MQLNLFIGFVIGSVLTSAAWAYVLLRFREQLVARHQYEVQTALNLPAASSHELLKRTVDAPRQPRGPAR